MVGVCCCNTQLMEYEIIIKMESEREKEPLALRTVTDTRLKAQWRGNAHPLVSLYHTTVLPPQAKRRRKRTGGGPLYNSPSGAAVA